jgi:hypothetical protein
MLYKLVLPTSVHALYTVCQEIVSTGNQFVILLIYFGGKALGAHCCTYTAV